MGLWDEGIGLKAGNEAYRGWRQSKQGIEGEELKAISWGMRRGGLNAVSKG
jgi:hypothetical protein